MMNLRQWIVNKDVKLKLFAWSWATKDPERYRVYNVLLDDFLAKQEIAKLMFRPKILYHWHLYCGALQAYVLNDDKNEKLDKLVKLCPLSLRELKTLFNWS